MKKMKCLDCKEMFEAKTPEAMLKAMMPHYMAKHKAMMEKGTEAKKKVWMEKFYREWDRA